MEENNSDQQIKDPTKEGVQGLKGVNRIDRKEDPYLFYADNYKQMIHTINTSTPQKESIGRVGINDSKWDKYITSASQLDNLNDTRGRLQSSVDQVANGIAKGAVLAATTFLEGNVGLLYGIGSAINQGKFSGIYDNDFSRGLKAINDYMEKILPNYYTDEEQQAPWYENIISANFLGDKLIKNLGFTVGAMYGGGVWVKALGGAAKAIGALAKSAKLPSMISSGIGATLGAFNEGRIEALNNSTDWFNTQKQELDYKLQQRLQSLEALKGTPQYDILAAQERENYESTLAKLEEDKGKMGNLDLMLNLPILLSSNLLQFGKLYSNGFKTARKMTRIIDRGRDFYENLAKKVAGETAEKAAEKTISRSARRAAVRTLKKQGQEVTEEAIESTARAAAKANAKTATEATERFATEMTTERGVVRAALNPFSEGIEEISQKAAATISGLGYEQDVTNFYKAKIDGDAEQKSIDWIKAAGQGLMETVSDGSSWEEFFIGSLTGALGIPKFRSFKNAEGKFQSPIYLQGGIVGEFQEYKEKMAREQRIADYLNKRVQDPNFLNYYRGLIRRNALQSLMNIAAQDNSEFDFKNAEFAQLISDISMFDSVGKLEELKYMISEGFDVSDDNLDSIVRNTTSIEQQGDGKIVLNGPFAQWATLNKDGEIESIFANEKSKQEMRAKLEENKEEIMKAIDRFQKIKDEIDINTQERLGDDQLEELTYIQSQIENWKDRRAQMFTKIQKLLKLGFNNPRVETSDAFKELMQSTDAEDFSSKITKDLCEEIINVILPKSAMNTAQRNNVIQMLYDINKVNYGINLYNEKLQEYLENPSSITADLKKAKDDEEEKQNEKKASSFKENLANATDTIDFRNKVAEIEDDDLKNKAIDDLVEEGNETAKNYKEVENYNRRVRNVINSSSLLPEDKQNAIKLFNNHYGHSSNLKEVSNPDSVFINDEEILRDNTLSDDDNTKRFLQAKNAVLKAMQEIAKNDKFNSGFKVTHTPRPKVSSHRDNLEKTGVLKKGESIAKTIYNYSEDGDDSKRGLSKEQANMIKSNVKKVLEIEGSEKQLQNAIVNRKTNAAANIAFLDKFKVAFELYKKGDLYEEDIMDMLEEALDLQDPNAKSTGSFPGVSNITTGSDAVSTTPAVNQAKPAIVADIDVPVGDIPNDQVGLENKEYNDATDKARDAESKEKNSRHYYRPTIPEVHIEASKEGDFRPFNEVVKEREGKDFDAIYNYLLNNDAFEYVNEGNLSVGDEIGFMIDPEFNDHTIFLVDTRNNQIVGSLDESQYVTDRYDGLTSLEEKIRQEYKEKGNSTERFYATPKTIVSKIMLGKIAYSTEEKSLDTVPNVHSKENPAIFGIIKNGVLDTNGAIHESEIVKPMDMSNKEGRLYLLVPNAAGGYSPVAVRVKHFNEKEFNANDATVQNTTAFQLIKEGVEEIARCRNDEELKSAISTLKHALYLGNMHIDWVSSDKGTAVRFTKVERDSNGKEIYTEVDGKRIRKEISKTVYFTSKSNVVFSYTKNDDGTTSFREGGVTSRDEADIIEDIMNTLMEFNLPIQVELKQLNKGGYNVMLVNSGVLTSNIIDAKMKSAWFVTDYIDDNGNAQTATPPASIGHIDTTKRVQTPAGGTESAVKGTQVTDVASGKTYFVDNKSKTIRDGQGKLVTITPGNEILFDIAWAQEVYGDKTVGYGMIDNKVILPNGKVLNRTTQTYIEGQEAEDTKNKINGTSQVTKASTREVLDSIERDQKKVDTTRTDNKYYYVLEEDGQYHQYERVHSVIGDNYNESESTKKTIDGITRNLSEYANDSYNYRAYISRLEAYYKIDLSYYKDKTSAKDRQSIITLIKDAINNINSSKALKAGSAIDQVIRDFFNPDPNSSNPIPSRPENMSEEAFDGLLLKLGDIKYRIDMQGEKFLTNNIVLFHKYADGRRIAGEVDILAIDKYGNFKIYDVKTSRFSFYPNTNGLNLFNWTINGVISTKEQIQEYINKNFKNPWPLKANMSQFDYYTLQLSAYKNLFESHYHTPIIGLYITPFVLGYGKDKDKNTITYITREGDISVAYNPNVPVPLEASDAVAIPSNTPITSTNAITPDAITPNTIDSPTITPNTFSGNDNDMLLPPSSTLAISSQPLTQSNNSNFDPRFNNEAESLSPIDRTDEKYSLEESKIGYYAMKENGEYKVYKSPMIYVTTVEGAPIYLVKIPNEKKAIKGLDGKYTGLYAETGFAPVFSNGHSQVLLTENKSSYSIGDIVEQIKEYIENNIEKIKEVSNRETPLSELAPVPDPDSNSSQPPSQPLSNAQKSYGKLNRLRSNNNDDSTRLSEATQDTYEIWDREKELAWLERVLPQLSEQDRVRVVKGLIEVAGKGTKAWGMFNKGIITLSDIAAAGVTYHEAFHVVFNLLMNDQERTILYEEARQMYDKNGNMSLIDLEEAMAEGFREYVMTRENMGLLRKIREFFEELLAKITHWKRVQPHLTSYYQMINSGKYARKSLSKSNTTTYSEEQYTLEMLKIKEEAIKDGTFMKAPNGKDTHLTERQWLQVRTKAFKDWFGDWENEPENASKVVDPETGEPMVVYHATDADFTTFSYDNFGKTDSGTVGKGFYFSANKDYIKHYGNKVIAVFLNIKEPVDLRGKGYSHTDIQAYISIDDKIFWAQTNIGQKRPSDGVIVDQLESIGLNNKTYDSVEYVSFDPNQIKSATDNIGTFDPNNDDIRYWEIDDYTQESRNAFSIPKEEKKYVYHRTKKQGLQKILKEGFNLKTGNRRESGPGIYSFDKLENANSPYAKKHYGNFIIRIPTEAVFEDTDKITAMKETKEGIYKNRKYNIPYLGDVTVLYDLPNIENLEYSQDNGKTWRNYKGELVGNNASSNQNIEDTLKMVYGSKFLSEYDYTKFLDEMALSRDSVESFLINFSKKVLQVNPKNKNIKSAYEYALNSKNTPIGFRENIIPFLHNIFSYDFIKIPNLENKKSVLERVARELDSWEDKLKEIIKDTPSYYKLEEERKELQQYISKIKKVLNNPDPNDEYYIQYLGIYDEYIQRRQDLESSGYDVNKKVSFNSYVGKFLHEAYVELQRLDESIKNQKFAHSSRILAAKNRLTALYAIDNIKELILKRVEAEIDSYTMNEKEYQKAEAVRDLYEAKLNADSRKIGVVKGLISNEVKMLSLEELEEIVLKEFPEYSEFFKTVKKYNPNIKIEIGAALGNSGLNEIAGMYNTKINKILYPGNPDITAIIHELAHSITAHSVMIHGEKANAFKKSIDVFMDYIRDYVRSQGLQDKDMYSTFAGPAGIYGFTNAAEFLAELYANEGFRNFLKIIPPMKAKQFKSLFEEIMDVITTFIKSIFGKRYKTALDQAFTLGEAAINLQDSFKDMMEEMWENNNKNIENSSFDSVNEDFKELLINKGWTKEKFDSLSQRERDKIIDCIAF